MIQYFGYQNDKHKVFETEEGVLLEFRGPDADKFEQLYPPKTKKVVPFELTESEFLGLNNEADESFVVSAKSWEVGQCEEGHTVVTLLDKFDDPIAEAHVGHDEDVDHLILALIDGCRGCMIERLHKLLEKVGGSTAGPAVVGQAQIAA
jgi:hypothetical protein